MGLATCPEGTPSGSLLEECGPTALCSTWWSGEEGASSDRPLLGPSPSTHWHFHVLTSDLTYSWDVPGETGSASPSCPGWNPGEWGRSPLLCPSMTPTPLLISFDVILLQLSRYFLRLFNPWD